LQVIYIIVIGLADIYMMDARELLSKPQIQINTHDDDDDIRPSSRWNVRVSSILHSQLLTLLSMLISRRQHSPPRRHPRPPLHSA
jgi:hypothetical protein